MKLLTLTLHWTLRWGGVEMLFDKFWLKMVFPLLSSKSVGNFNVGYLPAPLSHTYRNEKSQGKKLKFIKQLGEPQKIIFFWKSRWQHRPKGGYKAWWELEMDDKSDCQNPPLAHFWNFGGWLFILFNTFQKNHFPPLGNFLPFWPLSITMCALTLVSTGLRMLQIKAARERFYFPPLSTLWSTMPSWVQNSYDLRWTQIAFYSIQASGMSNQKKIITRREAASGRK